jgi:hypothetical protein
MNTSEFRQLLFKLGHLFCASVQKQKCVFQKVQQKRLRLHSLRYLQKYFASRAPLLQRIMSTSRIFQRYFEANIRQHLASRNQPEQLRAESS